MDAWLFKAVQEARQNGKPCGTVNVIVATQSLCLVITYDQATRKAVVAITQSAVQHMAW